MTFKLENGTNLPTGTSLEVKSLTVKSKAKADIVITNDSDPVLTPAVLDNDVVSFAFPTTGTDPVHTFTNTDAVSLGGSIMVIPGETVYDLIVDLVQKNGSDEIVGSSQSVDLDITLGGAQFKAGYSYEVTVKVYAAQAVVLDVSIVDWKAGESIYVDNDNDDDVAGVDPTKLYATPDYVRSTDTELVFSVNVPDGEYYNVQAALSTDPNNYDSNAEWVSVVGLTKAETGTVTFTNFYAEKVYYCHLRYTDTDVTVDEDTEFTDAAKPAEDNYLVSPAFEIEKGYLVENSWESYSKLPQFYLNRYPEITEATWEDAAPTDLPWLAVECTPTDKEVVINVYKDGSLIKTFQGAGWIPYNGLITISGEELGYATLETGVYDVKVDGISAPAITVS